MFDIAKEIYSTFIHEGMGGSIWITLGIEFWIVKQVLACFLCQGMEVSPQSVISSVQNPYHEHAKHK